jgi:hypothetical protein
MKPKLIALLFVFFTLNNTSFAQDAPFQIAISPIAIDGLGGLQSYAWAQKEGKWLIIGGRLDGLHRRQPFAAFDVAGNNNQIIVVDVAKNKKWTAPLSVLPVAMQEQLSSTNMSFYQEGEYLYVIGGYGYSATAGDHMTYPNLCAIKIAEVIDAVENSSNYSSFFRQIHDTLFAVTGGYLNKIFDTYYLTGGQNFIGRYNPMGPNQGPGFIQEYTNAIRTFKINDNGNTIKITHLKEMIDATNLHRRDYNVIAQIMPNVQEGITAFSGVFQASVDLPYLNCVNIDSAGYTVNNSFSQYYNHYHCAHIPLYSASKNEMHNVFFGGIAQYHDSAGILVQDNEVPFVKTIARVTRNANGVMQEYKLPIEMPAYLGAGSEFIPIDNLPSYNNEVLKLDEIKGDSTLIGYIFGGINSSNANIFFTNTGTQSTASSQIFKVYLVNNKSVGIDQLNTQSTGTLHMQVYPNPSRGKLYIQFNLLSNTPVKITIQDELGKVVLDEMHTDFAQGENTFNTKIEHLNHAGSYFVTIETKTEKVTQKIILTP